MTKWFYVFKYFFDEYIESGEGARRTVEKIPTHAVAVVPAEDCTVLMGGGATWILHSVSSGVDQYVVDGEPACLEGDEAMAHALEIKSALMEQGTIAKDPRILKPPKNFAPLKIAK